MTKRIILAVSGSISAYKSADLTSKLKKKGYDIHVIMTESAQSFITPLTLQALSKNPVHSDVMQEILPKSGLLACGDTGRGALADISVIIESIDNALTK